MNLVSSVFCRRGKGGREGSCYLSKSFLPGVDGGIAVLLPAVVTHKGLQLAVDVFLAAGNFLQRLGNLGLQLVQLVLRVKSRRRGL